MTHILGVALHDNEERCAVLRRDVRALFPQFVFGVVWLLLPFFFFFPLLRLGGFGFGVILVLAMSGLWYLLRLRASWYGTALVITTARCIDVTRRGFAAPVATPVPWSDVSDVVCRPSIAGRILGIGTLSVQCAERGFNIVLSGVGRPRRAQELLVEVQCLRSVPPPSV